MMCLSSHYLIEGCQWLIWTNAGEMQPQACKEDRVLDLGQLFLSCALTPGGIAPFFLAGQYGHASGNCSVRRAHTRIDIAGARIQAEMLVLMSYFHFYANHGWRQSPLLQRLKQNAQASIAICCVHAHASRKRILYVEHQVDLPAGNVNQEGREDTCGLPSSREYLTARMIEAVADTRPSCQK